MPIRIAQTVGITTVSALAGMTFSFSAFVVPRILESPSPLLLRQWNHTFRAGMSTIAPLASLSALLFWCLAYKAKNAPNVMPHRWKSYLVTGALAIGILPYTAGLMLPTNKKLLDKAKETSSLAVDDKLVEVGMGGETAHQLVDKWATLNLGRAILLGIAAVLGTWTALE